MKHEVAIGTNQQINSLTHSLTHSLTRSLAHSITDAFIRSTGQVASEAAFADETLCSLRFGERLASVRTSAAPAASADAGAVYAAASAELSELRRALQSMELAGQGESVSQ